MEFAQPSLLSFVQHGLSCRPFITSLYEEEMAQTGCERSQPPTLFAWLSPNGFRQILINPSSVLSEMANILPMNTFFDIVSFGDQAAAEGQPLVSNWVQVRGHLYLFGHACGGLDQCIITDFEARFPENYRDLDPLEQELYPSALTYQAAQREVSRLLAALGHIEDPWEALRVMIRQADRDDIERNLPGLKTPAIEAGLSPADIRTDWVWSLDAEKGIVTEDQIQQRKEREARTGKVPAQGIAVYMRQRLRASVAKFNELFDIEAIANSGLLPSERIGDPPVYDRAGRKKVSLPPKLDVKGAALGIYPVWRAICFAGGLGLPDDPSPDDLIVPETWARITEIPPSTINVKPTSWHQYLTRARSQLLSVATKVPEDPNTLPDRFEVMVQAREDRWSFNLLWSQMRAVGIPGIQDAGAVELLDLEVWRALLRTENDVVSTITFRQFMMRARQIILRNAPDQIDPLRLVTSAWLGLPDHIKVALAPIRKAAQAAYLRPEDVTVEWLDELEQEGLDMAAVCKTLDGLSEAIRVAHEEALAAAPEPEWEKWQTLREVARSRGFTTSMLGIIVTPAVESGMSPTDLDRDWVLRMSADFPSQRKAKLGVALRELDAMLDDPQVSPLLYATSLGPLPDDRSPGMIVLPDRLVAQLTAVHDALGSADSTRRESRAVVRKLATAAVQRELDISDLDKLLKQAVTLGFEGVTLRKAQRLREHLVINGRT